MQESGFASLTPKESSWDLGLLYLVSTDGIEFGIFEFSLSRELRIRGFTRAA